jgi:hypothetical protein
MTFSRARASLAQRLGIEQDAHRRVGAAPDPAAQLVQLGKAEALGVLDHHQAGVGHIDADLDHRGRHQHLDLVAQRRPPSRRPSRRLEPAVHQADLQVGQRRRRSRS